MQTTATDVEGAASQRQDARLFREACYVDGLWIQAASGQAIGVDNPATGEIIGKVPKLGGLETRQAIEAGNRAFPEWKKKTAKARPATLRRWVDGVVSSQGALS